jgi:hypothetical protein
MKLSNVLAVIAALMFVGINGEAEGVPTSVTGTVVSSTADRVVVRTSSGDMTFKMSSTTDRPATFTTGKQVTVWYDPATVPGEDQTHLAMRVASADESVRTTAAQESYGADDELPATAGPLPLLAWIGLVALGGGLGLRMLSRRRAQ